jgi:8-oxo-dGTP diphosphatase
MIVAANDIFPQVQFAYGGVVWRNLTTLPEIAVIHRPKYDDWTMPKGKPEAGEIPAETARREVMEEVACEPQFLDFAGACHYTIGHGRTKVVLYWHMAVKSEGKFVPNEEVDQVLWLPLREAAARLTHPPEREMLERLKKPVVPAQWTV